MSKYTAIKKELDSNVGLYGTMTDQEVVDSLTTNQPPAPRSSIPGSELFGYTDPTEYGGLPDAGKQQWLGLCGIDIVTKDAVPIIQSLFNGGSTTWSNIVKTVVTTRAQDLGLGRLSENDITVARAQ